MNVIKEIHSTFWNQDFWLPKNSDWDEISTYNKYSFTNLIVIPTFVALILFFIRIYFEKIIGIPLGRYLDLNEQEKNFIFNKTLEKYYNKHLKITYGLCEYISKETSLEPDQIRNWFKARLNSEKPSTLKKFSESSWRFFFYTLIWFYGIVILFNKPWMWDVSECWFRYPKHKITNDVYWYYMIELGFYISLFVTQFFDIKRKDFWQMFLHHIVTIKLIVFSYVCNFVRLGTLVLAIHDLSDCWLEISKMASYAKFKKMCNVTFTIFGLTWFFTRLIAFPLIILKSTTIDAQNFIGLFPAFYFFNILLFSLQIMHIIWFYYICKTAFKAFTDGDFVDDRSESEEFESEKDEEELAQKYKKK